MAKSYSMDLRERVLKDCDTGMRSEDVAKKYSVSASWVYDLRKKRRDTGSIAPKQQRHGSKPKLEPYEKEVRQPESVHDNVRLEWFAIAGRGSCIENVGADAIKQVLADINKYLVAKETGGEAEGILSGELTDIAENLPF